MSQENGRLRFPLGETSIEHRLRHSFKIRGVRQKLLSKTPHQKPDFRENFQKASGKLPGLDVFLPGRAAERSMTLLDAEEALYDDLQAPFNALEALYDALEALYDALETLYDALKAHCDALEAFYDALGAFYDALEIFYDALEAIY